MTKCERTLSLRPSLNLSRAFINFFEIGLVKAVFDRRYVGTIKTVTVTKDSSGGMFVNFLSYKLEREDKRLVEISRWFPSSHICPDCLTQTPKLDLSIREWTCLNQACGKTHDRDEAASRNIRAEGIRIIKVASPGVSPGVYANRKTDGTAVSANGGSVRPDRGRKTKVRQHPGKLETQSSLLGRAE